MIILPDRNIPRAKILIPMHKKHWITPSQAQKKDQFGNEDNTKFRIHARTNDGVVIWTGWFDDRADFDAFLWAIVLGTLKQEKALWDLPTPNWQPYLGDLITYEFASLSFYSSPTGSNQNYTAPLDWNSSNNTIEVVGGGSTGGPYPQAAGGGGGGYSKISNQTLTRGGTYVYRIGSAGSAGAAAVAGGDTWFGNTTLATSFVGAKGGNLPVPTSSNTPGGLGGAAASGVGTVKYSGGNGGNSASTSTLNTTYSGGGGGGSAGPNGNGGNGGCESSSGGGGYYSAGGGGGNGGGSAGIAGDILITYYGGNGGNGYLGVSSPGGNGGYYNIPGSAVNGTNGGGGGGGGSDGSTSSSGANGGMGQEWSSSYGTGGGGGGGGYYAPSAGSAAAYGGGGGGEHSSTTGGGGQGLLVITYTPGMSYPDLFTFGFF